MPAVYEDELLYSVLARQWHYMGRPPQIIWRNHLFDAAVRAAFDLPTRIQLISSCLDAGAAFEVDAIIDGMTLFNYHAAFVAPSVAQAAREAMVRGGKAPHAILGLNTQSVPPVSRLRFCPECLHDWRAAGEDARWVRSLQVPSTLVCPIHEVVLRHSTVDVSATGRNSYVPASEASCPVDAQRVVGEVDHFMIKRLTTLARDGAKLLVKPPRRRQPSEWKGLYRKWLYYEKIAENNSKYSAKVRLGLECYWGQCLCLWDGAAKLASRGSSLNWAMKLTMQDCTGSPPLFHLLFKRYLIDNHLKFRDNGYNFGNGPWACVNPVAAHQGSMCVTQMTRMPSRRRRFMATFHCDCGLVYSRGLDADGTISKPRTVIWGQEVERFVIHHARAGRSANWIGRKIGGTAKTVLLITDRLGLDVETEFGWKESLSSWRNKDWSPYRPPGGRRSSSIVDRFGEIRIKRRRGRAFLDWSSIDVELSAELPLVLQKIKETAPPVRVTAALLARYCGWRAGWLVRCMDRLPILRPFWNEAIESTWQWHERRRVYAVGRLLAESDLMNPAEKRVLRLWPGVRDTLRSMMVKPLARLS